MALTQQQPERSAALDAEYAVLGSMLIDAGTIPQALSELTPEDFESDVNRELFAGIRALFRSGQPVDAVTVVDRLGWSQDQDRRAYVAELLTTTPTSANCAEYARIVREQATLRTVGGLALRLAGAHTLADCAEPYAGITDALGAGRKVEAWTIAELLADFAERKGRDAPKDYVTIGLQEIDDNTFLERGDVMVIGGAPSDGKTAFALACAYHMAQKYNVGFYSLETRHGKLEDRLVACGFGIDFGAIKRSQLTDQDWMDFNDALPGAAARRLTVLSAAGMTADQLTGSARARGFEVIFIDYVQLITPTTTGRGVSRAEQMAEISQALHTFAQTTDTLVVELAQLTRQERGTKRERDMFDLSESSQFEKDADLILLLYRPGKDAHFVEGDKQSETLDPDKTRILRIAKQKEGKRVRLPLRFDGEHQRFEILHENSFMAVKRSIREAKKKSVVEGGVQEFITLPAAAEKEMPF